MHLAVDASKLKLFRILGVLTLIIGFGHILLYFANAETRQHGGRDLSWTLWSGLLTVFISVCVMLLMRWAIILTSLCYVFLGGWLIVGSMLHVPFPWCLINIGIGLVFLIPIALLARAIMRARIK